jgi:hypothetical protein
VAGDCASGVCSGKKCAAPTCTDGVKNGSEADVDCGGTCPACAEGRTCRVANDCVSRVCSGTCDAPSCTDFQQNGAETAVDCGGPACPRCARLEHCLVSTDCESGVCMSTACR